MCGDGFSEQLILTNGSSGSFSTAHREYLSVRCVPEVASGANPVSVRCVHEAEIILGFEKGSFRTFAAVQSD